MTILTKCNFTSLKFRPTGTFPQNDPPPKKNCILWISYDQLTYNQL